jgi:hypothetical protein
MDDDIAHPQESTTNSSSSSSSSPPPPPKCLVEFADCGDPENNVFYLSYAKARRFKDRNHPRNVTFAYSKDSIGNFTLPNRVFKRHGYCCTANIGRHPCCLPRSQPRADLILNLPNIKGDYDRYGDGVLLYFKVLSYFSYVFFILSILSIPSMLMFFSGNQLSTTTDTFSTASSVAASSASASSTSYVAYLSKFSLGNLGEATAVCSSGYSTQSSFVSLSCPTGYVMLTTEAIYGAPSGECLCPGSRVPSPLCPSSHSAISTSLSMTVTPCDPPGSFCERSEKRPVKVPSGESFLAGACCASSVDSTGKPSFKELDFSIDPFGCNADSITVNRIVRGKCIGKQTCSISLNPNATQTWTSASMSSIVTNLNNGAGNGLQDYVTMPECPPNKRTANGLCFDTLSSGGGLQKCIDRGPFSLPYSYRNTSGFRLALFAKCYKSSLTMTSFAKALGAPSSMTKTDVAFYTSLFSALSMIVLILSYCLLTEREGRVSSQYVTAADYTIMVTRLPEHKSLEELDLVLRQHFESVLLLRPMESTVLPEAAQNSAKQTANKVKREGGTESEIHAAAEHAALTTCVRVADINFGLTKANSLYKFKERGDLLRQLEKLSRIELILHHLEKSPNNIKRLKKTCSDLEEVKKKLKEVDKKLDDLYSGSNRAKLQQASFAFITFHQEEGALRALSAYPQSPFNWLCMPKDLRVQETTRIWVAPAPEPSDIRWENLSVPLYQHILRRLLNIILLACALLGAAFLIFLATAKRRELESTYPVVTCSQLLALSNGGGGPLGLLSSESPTSISLSMNATKGRFLINSLLDEGPSNAYGGFSKIGVLADIYWSGLGLSSGNSGALGCYCMSLFTNRGLSALRSETFPALLPINATLSQRSAAAASRDVLCDEWVFAYAYASAFLYGAAFITIAINVVLNQLVFIGVAFEKHNNATSELRARALYLFVLQFINTGLLVLLLNAQITSPTFSLLRSGENSDFNASWYTSVGTSIILTMLLNIIVPHVMPFLLTLYASMKRCCDRDCSDNRKITHKYTQAELNELHLGPEMQIDERYAQLYNTIFVCLGYSAGMPLLVPILFGYVVITLAVDSCLFATSYRTPPNYSASLPRAFTSLIPFTAVLHLGFASWMLSNENIFPSQTAIQDSPQLSNLFLIFGGSKGAFIYASRFVSSFNPNDLQIGERISSIQVLPLISLLALLVAFLAISRLIVSSIFRPLLHLCSCDVHTTAKSAVTDALKTKQKSEENDTDEKQWCRIKRAKKEKGLSSYFRAIPTDDVDAVVRGLRFVKPRLQPFYEAAHKAHSKQGAKEEITQLVSAYEDAEQRDKDALSLQTRSETEVKEIRASIQDVLDNGITRPTSHQIFTNPDLRRMHFSAQRMSAARDRIVEKTNRSIKEGKTTIDIDILDNEKEGGEEGGDSTVSQSKEDPVFRRSSMSRRGSNSVQSATQEDDISTIRRKVNKNVNYEEDLTVEPVETGQRLLIELEERLQSARLAHARSSLARIAATEKLEDLRKRMREIFKRNESNSSTQSRSTVDTSRVISGLYSYDLHDNREYASLWGLDTEIDDKLKRRLGELFYE